MPPTPNQRYTYAGIAVGLFWGLVFGLYCFAGVLLQLVERSAVIKVWHLELLQQFHPPFSPELGLLLGVVLFAVLSRGFAFRILARLLQPKPKTPPTAAQYAITALIGIMLLASPLFVMWGAGNILERPSDIQYRDYVHGGWSRVAMCQWLASPIPSILGGGIAVILALLAKYASHRRLTWLNVLFSLLLLVQLTLLTAACLRLCLSGGQIVSGPR